MSLRPWAARGAPRISWALALMLLVGGIFAGGVSLAAGGASPVGERPAVLKADAPFKVTSEAKRTKDGALLRISIWMFKDDHYLYEDATSVKVEPPPGVKVGAQRLPPSKTKFDENFGEDVSVLMGTPTFEIPLEIDPSLSEKILLPVTVKYRGCNPTQCFFPQVESLSLTLDLTQPAPQEAMALPPAAHPPGGDAPPPLAPPAVQATQPLKAPAQAAALAPAIPPVKAAPVKAASASEGGLFGTSDVGAVAQESLLLALVLAFGAGILTSLTPCVYPVIPITLRVLGASQSSSKVAAFSLAFVYVLGMALIYTTLGVVAASSGGYLGQWLQSKAVLGFLVVVFVAMGFSMLGAFDLALPSGVAERLQNVEGRGYPGAFLAGAVSGIVVGPCSAPVLLSLLAYIAQTGNMVVGSLLMFTYAMGIGVLFLVLGTFAASVTTPRSGPWMDAVKGVLALLIFGVALYYLGFLIPDGPHAVVIGAFAIITGVFVGAFHPVQWDDLWPRKARKALGVIAVALGLFFTAEGLLLARGGVGLSGLAARGGAPAAESSTALRWERSVEEGLKLAAAAGKPAIIDFTADWCAACQEIKHQVFPDEGVQSELARFVPIMVDATDDEDPAIRGLMKRYGVLALPKIVFVEADGAIREDLAVTALVEAEDFRRRLAQVGSPQ